VVVLHAAALTIVEAWLVTPSGGRFEFDATIDTRAQRLTLRSPTELPRDGFAVHLRFRGSLNDRPFGLHRIPVTSDDGASDWVLTAQMEPAFARFVFPCWDEPD